METGPSKIGGWFSVMTPLWPLGLARILYGLLWWQQSKWKVPSDDFGRKSGGGLWFWVQQEIQYPTVSAYKEFLVNVLVPHWTFFGYMTLVTETFIGVTLILGLFTSPTRILFRQISFTAVILFRGESMTFIGAILHCLGSPI